MRLYALAEGLSLKSLPRRSEKPYPERLPAICAHWSGPDRRSLPGSCHCTGAYVYDVYMLTRLSVVGLLVQILMTVGDVTL